MIVVMAKVPRAGFAKTRLIPSLGAPGAAELCAAMTADVFERVAETGLPWRVAVAGPMDDPWVARIPTAYEPQAEGTLTERLTHALRDGGVAIGSDCPLLPAALLHEAHAASEDLLLATAEDGGYVLVAATAEAVRRGVFADVEWSTARTLASQRARAEALGLRVRVVPGGYDVDEPADVHRLRTESILPTHTAAWLQRTAG